MFYFKDNTLYIILFEALFWLLTPIFFLDFTIISKNIKYFFKKIKFREAIYLIYNQKITSLLFDLYITSSINSNFEFYNQIRDRLFKRMEKVLIEKNNIIKLLNSKNLTHSKRRLLLNKFDKIKSLASLYKTTITSAISLEKINAFIDKKAFENYIKQLDEVDEISLDHFFPNSFVRGKSLKDGSKIK